MTTLLSFVEQSMADLSNLLVGPVTVPPGVLSG